MQLFGQAQLRVLTVLQHPRLACKPRTGVALKDLSVIAHDARGGRMEFGDQATKVDNVYETGAQRRLHKLSSAGLHSRQPEDVVDFAENEHNSVQRISNAFWWRVSTRSLSTISRAQPIIKRWSTGKNSRASRAGRR